MCLRMTASILRDWIIEAGIAKKILTDLQQ